MDYCAPHLMVYHGLKLLFDFMFLMMNGTIGLNLVDFMIVIIAYYHTYDEKFNQLT